MGEKKNHCNKTLAAAAVVVVNDSNPYCNEYSLSVPYADLFNF